MSNTRGQIQNKVAVKVAVTGSVLTSEWLPVMTGFGLQVVGSTAAIYLCVP